MKTRKFQNNEGFALKTIKKVAILHGMIAFHYVVTVALFLGCWIIFYRFPAEQGEYFVHDRSICASYILLLAIFSQIYSGYKVGVYRVGELVYGQFFANLMSWGFTYFLACIMAQKLLNPLMGVVFLLVQISFGAMWTMYTNKIYFYFFKPKRTIVLYRNRSDLEKIEELAAAKGKWQIVDEYCCLRREDCESLDARNTMAECGDREKLIDDDIQKIMEIIDEYEAVVVTGVNATVRNGIVKHCVDTKKDCYFVPHTGDVMISGATHMKAFSVPIFHVKRSNPNPEFLFLKRAFDIFVSGVALLILWPIMLITGLAIKFYDHGPVFYSQTRLTKDGKTFEVLKFRSMRVSAEKDGIARLATENDERITPIGKIIRTIRFDELPQLVNILKGDMSIVGPRPERPEIAERYLKEIPAFNLRLQVKAGLTGYAQVYGRYNTEPIDKLKMDLIYINNMSIVEDLKIIMATLQILFMKESSQGIKADCSAVKSGEPNEKVV